MTTPERTPGTTSAASLTQAFETFMTGSAGVPPVELIARMANAYFQDAAEAVPAGGGTPFGLELPAGADLPPTPALVPFVGGGPPRPALNTATAPGPAPSGPSPAVAAPADAYRPPAVPVTAVTPAPPAAVPGLGGIAPWASLPVDGPTPDAATWPAWPADLRAVPTTNSSDVVFSRAATTTDGFSFAAPAGPEAGPGFPGDAVAAASSPRAPFSADVLTLPPESVSYSPSRVPSLAQEPRPFDPYAVKRDFPILGEQVNGRPLVWLDNGATTQKPRAVIDRLVRFYEHENSNVHRGAHTLAARATDAYEGARETVRRFLGAASTDEIVFVRGTTEGINLVSQSWGRANVGAGDEIVVTHLEHHANIVPWQQLAAEKGARLRVAPVDDTGQIIFEQYLGLLGPRTKLVAIAAVSNALGTITPAQAMAAAAHAVGAHVLIDGAQAVSHMPVDVQSLGADFFVFSGHKLFAPTGVGVVYGRKAVLDAMPPWQGGGNMIADVTFERTVFQPPPARFEAGTGTIADAVGLGAAIDYVTAIGMPVIAAYEHALLEYATAGLRQVPGLRIIGTATEKAGVLSFVLQNVEPVAVGKALDREGIAVRSGHHCAQPILRRFGVEGTVRASLAPYNTCEDIDALVAALQRIAGGR